MNIATARLTKNTPQQNSRHAYKPQGTPNFRHSHNDKMVTLQIWYARKFLAYQHYTFTEYNISYYFKCFFIIYVLTMSCYNISVDNKILIKSPIVPILSKCHAMFHLTQKTKEDNKS